MVPRALLAHIISQTRQNVEFLMSQREISHADGGEILAKLPRAPEAPVAGPSQAKAKAKALWSYNEEGVSANGLTFRAGDIIEVFTEPNADWWYGRCNGSQGLFPSNHVRRLPGPALTSPPNRSISPVPNRSISPVPAFPTPHQAPSSPPMDGPYPAFPPPYQRAPPPNSPPMSGYSPYAPPPAAVAQSTHVGPPVPPKTVRFDLGDTSAADDVGYGVGDVYEGDLMKF